MSMYFNFYEIVLQAENKHYDANKTKKKKKRKGVRKCSFLSIKKKENLNKKQMITIHFNIPFGIL